VRFARIEMVKNAILVFIDLAALCDPLALPSQGRRGR
jgi:hypothetical protein